jgi:hypothetical protein
MIGCTFDHTPHLGNTERIHYSTGYCGSGVVRSAWFGNKIALKILGDAEGQNRAGFGGFPGAPIPLGCAGLRTGSEGMAPALRPDRCVIGIPGGSGRVPHAAIPITSTTIRPTPHHSQDRTP